MHFPGGLCIVFNGEIYNFKDLRSELCARGHHFRTLTDTEVILAAYREWGHLCVEHLNGMFAFALYDAPRRRMLLARDRAGEKPLFYMVSSGTLRFGSELKALMADPRISRRIDPHAFDCYLAMGFVPGESCILEGVRKLPPAHALMFDLENGESRVWRYWKLPQADHCTPGEGADEAALLDELEVLLEDAVRRQLVADVPVGVLLSGGVDSSLVTAMAARNTRGIKTFTVHFPGHRQYDESEHARLIARHFGTEHMELEASDASTDLLPILARQFDEPLVDSSMIPTYLISRLVRDHCTVALGGDGGDELFGGYAHYNRLLWLQEKASRVL
jgi:asparagine synthase (glutamine-hydrolysing)